MRVLVVDDEPVVRDLAVEALADAGFDAFGVENAVRALEVLGDAALPFDVLLTDVQMPQGNGLDLARIAKRLWPNMSVVMTSGYVAPADLPLGETILRKPWSLPDLVDRVRQARAQA
jgi:CheY-like chemotaxis protein